MRQEIGLYCEMAQQRPEDLSHCNFEDLIYEVIQRMKAKDFMEEEEEKNVGELTLWKYGQSIYVGDSDNSYKGNYWSIKPETIEF